MFTMDELEATMVSGNCWAFRPKGQLGTCGFYPRPWNVVYITAKTETEARRKLYMIASQQGLIKTVI